jgi:hypothetical protein
MQGLHGMLGMQQQQQQQHFPPPPGLDLSRASTADTAVTVQTVHRLAFGQSTSAAALGVGGQGSLGLLGELGETSEVVGGGGGSGYGGGYGQTVSGGAERRSGAYVMKTGAGLGLGSSASMGGSKADAFGLAINGVPEAWRELTTMHSFGRPPTAAGANVVGGGGIALDAVGRPIDAEDAPSYYGLHYPSAASVGLYKLNSIDPELESA